MGDISDYLEQLSSADPVPGGGSVAALQAAMAASLLAMVCRLTLGKKRYAEAEPAVSKLLERALQQRNHASDLSQKDIDAYQNVAESLALPRGTDDERESRRRAVQDALKKACQPPLETMRASAEILSAAQDLVAIGNRSAISDVAVAALAAGAAFRGAEFNVVINLALITDQEWVRDVQARVAALGRSEPVVDAVCTAAMESIHGSHA
ncbi:MAG TPA: cyclodeaminase/cyclohydrolase family protein [Chloroflexota bacterium]